jgi:uncharacterized ParB-like nuclease family protein
MQICGRLAVQGKPSYYAVSEVHVLVSTDRQGYAATLATVNNIIVCLTLGSEHDSDVVICCIIVQVRHFIGS